MTTLLISGPDDDDDPDPLDQTADGAKSAHPRSRASKRSRKARDNSFPTERECVEQLHRLSGLVALGLCPPNRANTIRANIREILAYHRQSQNGSDGKNLADADLLELARSNPKLVSQLEPFLTDDQLEMLMLDTEEDGVE